MKTNKGLTKFLKTALLPAHSTMYIWGGGWSANDREAGDDAKRIGLNPNWRRFYEMQSADYDYKQHKFEYGNGLDCSGYVGWTVYNYFGTDDKTSYVTYAKNQGIMLMEMGLGAYYSSVCELMPGDIVSSSDHVYIVVSECPDSSVILLHSSPPGVQLCGTSTVTGCEGSIANRLVENYTRCFYPKWYRKFSYCSRGVSYLRNCGVFRWFSEIMPDTDGLKNMPPEKVLSFLFNRRSI